MYILLFSKCLRAKENFRDTLGFVNAVVNNGEFLNDVQIFKSFGKIALQNINEMSVPESINQRVFNFNSPRENVEGLAEVTKLEL